MLMLKSSRCVPEVFARFLRLGLSSFGGPVAHLGYFRREFVERARWLDDATFGEIVAVCSALPGPTSSQVGMSLGALRAGPLGALAAWVAFTTPSAVLLGLFGLALRTGASSAFQTAPAWLGAEAGLLGAAAAVVVLAVYGLARSLAHTTATRAIAVAALVLALAVDRYAPQLQWLPLLGGALGGFFAVREGPQSPSASSIPRAGTRAALIAFGAFLALAVLLPAVAPPGSYVELFSQFFRAGSLVFGGGHVVLPLIRGFIGPEAISNANFFAGYAAAQAVPGPLFTFASFVGAANPSGASGAAGALVATLGIFAPSFFLLVLAFPLWNALRSWPRAAAVLAGINASVVGLLGAVAVDPIARQVVASPLALAAGIAALGALFALKAPSWAVVIASGALGCAAGALGAPP
jgi:chromate transporter